MSVVAQLREALPEVAKDLKLNLQSVLTAESLTPAQCWGTAIACAITTRNLALSTAIVKDARAVIDATVVADAQAAAALMAMNNIYYRFRHLVGKESYTAQHPRLRMSRIGKPATNKVDFELFCLAVSVINNCEFCVRAHEKAVIEGGLTETQVNDVVRIAATLHGVAVAMELNLADNE